MTGKTNKHQDRHLIRKQSVEAEKNAFTEALINKYIMNNSWKRKSITEKWNLQYKQFVSNMTALKSDRNKL